MIGWETVPDEELSALQEEALGKREAGSVSYCSCAECNSAHAHLHRPGAVLCCFACGAWWYGAVRLYDGKRLLLKGEGR